MTSIDAQKYEKCKHLVKKYHMRLELKAKFYLYSDHEENSFDNSLGVFDNLDELLAFLSGYEAGVLSGQKNISC